MVMMLIGLKIGEKVIGVLPWSADAYDFIMLAILFVLLLFSYRKQTQEVSPTGEVRGEEGVGVNLADLFEQFRNNSNL